MIAEIAGAGDASFASVTTLIITTVAVLFVIVASAAACGVYIGKGVVSAIIDLNQERPRGQAPAIESMEPAEEVDAYCGHCGAGISTDPEMEMVVEHRSYLVYKCPDCGEKTLQATPVIRE